MFLFGRKHSRTPDEYSTRAIFAEEAAKKSKISGVSGAQKNVSPLVSVNKISAFARCQPSQRKYFSTAKEQHAAAKFRCFPKRCRAPRSW
jgi:hypothetical protein